MRTSLTAELSPNRRAFPLVRALMANQDLLRVEVYREGGVTIIDCGVQVPGGWEAGVMFANICLGGLAQVNLHWDNLEGLRWPSVEVVTDHPVRACLSSQYAGWPITDGSSTAMGSGPGRAVIHQGKLFQSQGYEDDSETAILCLESTTLPTEGMLKQLLEQLPCEPKNLYILVAPTASHVGSVQIAARALETGLAKLMELDYDLANLLSGWGVCPLPPLGGDGLQALGRSNDAILYGSSVLYTLQDSDSKLAELVKQIPCSASQIYGQLFLDVFKGSFYDLDPLIFSPAEVCLCNARSGQTFLAGSKRPDLLKVSFGLVQNN